MMAAQSTAADFAKPESMLSATALGPLLASIGYSLTVYLGVPSGYSLLAASLAFAALIPIIHGEASRQRKAVYFVVGALVLFAQACGSSTVIGAASESGGPGAPAVIGSILMPTAHAEDQLAGYVVDATPTAYVVTCPDGSDIPVVVVPREVYEAIRIYEIRAGKRDRALSESPWQIRW
ncbi:MAG: hypothetical protein OEQ39_02930 [Gammaproteobacteria bacterium]|nr:hypothetical protein [Gammaproteobacteria bacterium]